MERTEWLVALVGVAVAAAVDAAVAAVDVAVAAEVVAGFHAEE